VLNSLLAKCWQSHDGVYQFQAGFLIIGGHNAMKCLENLLTSNALRDTLYSESYKRGGLNAGILHEVQKEG